MRFGKFMPMLAYPATVVLSNADPLVDSYSPFDIVDSPVSTFQMTEPMFGVSAFGMLPQFFEGLRWEVGFYGGNRSDIDLGQGRLLFAALDQTVYLSNAPLRFGLQFWGGRQGVATVRMRAAPWSNATQRFGADLEITDPWTKRVQISAQYVRGFDSNIDSSVTCIHTNMFLCGVNIIILPERLYAFARVDYAEAQPIADIHRQYDIGVRYHVLPNVVLTAGGTQLIRTQPGLNDRVTSTASLGVLFGF
jgi:hypothetical protein